MQILITTIILTVVIFLGAVVAISFAKRRTRNSKHELSGMCHETGGPMCCSCSGHQQEISGLDKHA